MKKFLLAFALSVLALSPAFAQSSYVVKDGNGNLQTIKSINCNSTICPASVPIDSNGVAFGVIGNPFFMSFAATPTVNLGSIAGISTASNQTSGSMKSQIVDGTGNVIGSSGNALNVNIVSGGGSGGTSSSFAAAFPALGTAIGMNQGGNMVALTGTAGNLNVNCTNCSGGSGFSTVDKAAFTAGTSLFAGAGGFFQTTATANPLTTGQQGMFQMTAQRAQFVNLRDSSGNELGLSGVPLQVSLANTTGNATPLLVTANLGTIAGVATQATLASVLSALGTPFQAGGSIANTTFAATQTTAANLNATVVGTGTFAVQSAPTSAPAWGINTLGSSTSGQSGQLALGAVTTAAPTYTTAQSNALSLTTAGALRVDGSAVVQPVSATSLPLPTGAATAANQTNASQKTQIVDGSGNIIASTTNALNVAVVSGGGGGSSFGASFPSIGIAVGMSQGGLLTAMTGTSGNLNVQCANCSGSGVSTADAATFTAGASLFAGSGGFFQTTATNNPLTTGQQGMFQVTANRALFTNLRNAAGTEVGTASTPLQVSLANTGVNGSAIAVSLASNQTVNVAQINGVTPLMGNGVTGTGSPRVTIASDNAAFSVNATVTQATSSNLKAQVDPLTAASWAIATASQNSTSPNLGHLVLGQFNTTPTTITSGNTSPIQLDAAGNVLVNIKAGSSSGAVAQGSTTSGQSGSLVQGAVTTSAPTYTTATTNPLSITTVGDLRVADASLLAAVQGATPPCSASPCTTTIGNLGFDPSSGKTTPSSVAINVSTATTTQLVAISGSTKIFVTSFDVMAGGAGNATFVYGTGSNCGTGTTSLTGAYPLTAQAGIAKGTGAAAVLIVPSGNALCISTSAAVQYSGSVSYQQI